MAVSLSRRNLLRGRAPNAAPPIRPPGAIESDLFADACTACGDCVSACPENIIVSGSGGYPEIDFRRGECTFCNACIDACEDAALSHEAPGLNIHLTVSDNCLAKKQVVCLSCGDACEANAIRFTPEIGRVATPVIDENSCTSCGACVTACPENAIKATANG